MPDGYCQIFRIVCVRPFGLKGLWLRYAATFELDPFLSLDCARVEGVWAQSKERKGSNFAFWQLCR